MKYYRTQRPIVPGSFPTPGGNKVATVHNYDAKTYCEEIGREAWGYIEYEQPLQNEDVMNYELTPFPRKVKKLQFLGVDSWDRMVFKDEDGYVWKCTEPGENPYEVHDRLYSSTNNDFDGEPCWPMSPDIDYQVKTAGSPENDGDD